MWNLNHRSVYWHLRTTTLTMLDNLTLVVAFLGKRAEESIHWHSLNKPEMNPWGLKLCFKIHFHRSDFPPPPIPETQLQIHIWSGTVEQLHVMMKWPSGTFSFSSPTSEESLRKYSWPKSKLTTLRGTICRRTMTCRKRKTPPQRKRRGLRAGKGMTEVTEVSDEHDTHGFEKLAGVS